MTVTETVERRATGSTETADRVQTRFIRLHGGVRMFCAIRLSSRRHACMSDYLTVNGQRTACCEPVVTEAIGATLFPLRSFRHSVTQYTQYHSICVVSPGQIPYLLSWLLRNAVSNAGSYSFDFGASSPSTSPTMISAVPVIPEASPVSASVPTVHRRILSSSQVAL